MPTIRQEINILCTGYTGTGTVSSNEVIQLDTTQYSGTVSYYFEAVYSGAASNTGNVRLTRFGTTTDDATVAGATSSTVILTRSTAFTPPVGQTQYIIRIVGDGTRSQTIKAARIIVIQTSPGPIVSTETQIEIGSNSSITATVIPTGATNATNPKYWLYTAANWGPTITAYFEATFANPASSKTAGTVELQHDDGSFGATWVNDVAITTTSATGVRVRSAAVTLTAGRHYRIVGASSSSKTAMVIYNAKIIIDSRTTDQQQLTGGTGFGIGDTSNSLIAQSFTAGASGALTVGLALYKVGSPSDSTVISLYDSSVGSTPNAGVLLGSVSILSSSLTSTNQPAFPTVLVTLPASVVSGQLYYIVLSRSGSQDVSNLSAITSAGSNVYAGGAAWGFGASWNQQTDDLLFTTIINQVLSLELQYLLANTVLAAGTALQNFLTKWDPAEWSTVNGTPSFNHDVDATGTNTVEVDAVTGPAQVSGSVVTNPSNEGTSAVMTMPAAGNLDVKATTNAGTVFASRILALAYLGPIRPLNPILLQAVKRATIF